MIGDFLFLIASTIENTTIRNNDICIPAIDQGAIKQNNKNETDIKSIDLVFKVAKLSKKIE